MCVWGGGGGGVRGGSMQSMVSPLFHCVSMGYIWVTVSSQNLFQSCCFFIQGYPHIDNKLFKSTLYLYREYTLFALELKLRKYPPIIPDFSSLPSGISVVT